MKFTHYDYKCVYYELSSITQKYERKVLTTSQRSQLALDLKYYTVFLSINTDDPQIEKFNIGISVSPTGAVLENRCQDRLYLNFNIKGQGKINGIPFSAGQFFYTAPLEVHTIETSKEDPYVSVWMSFDGSYTQHIINKLNQKSKNKVMRLDNAPDIMELTKTLLYSTNLGETSVDYLKSLLDIYLFYIATTIENEPEQPETGAPDKIAQLIADSKIYVRKNLKNVTVADMAAAQHYNTKYFSKVFIEAMGIRPLQYITDCRLEWAKNALAYSNLSINRIMETIGYEHRNGFSIAFKKKYGCSPSAFRRQAKNGSIIIDDEDM